MVLVYANSFSTGFRTGIQFRYSANSNASIRGRIFGKTPNLIQHSLWSADTFADECVVWILLASGSSSEAFFLRSLASLQHLLNYQGRYRSSHNSPPPIHHGFFYKNTGHKWKFPEITISAEFFVFIHLGTTECNFAEIFVFIRLGATECNFEGFEIFFNCRITDSGWLRTDLHCQAMCMLVAWHLYLLYSETPETNLKRGIGEWDRFDKRKEGVAKICRLFSSFMYIQTKELHLTSKGLHAIVKTMKFHNEQPT